MARAGSRGWWRVGRQAGRPSSSRKATGPNCVCLGFSGLAWDLLLFWEPRPPLGAWTLSGGAQGGLQQVTSSPRHRCGPAPSPLHLDSVLLPLLVFQALLTDPGGRQPPPSDGGLSRGLGRHTLGPLHWPFSPQTGPRLTPHVLQLLLLGECSPATQCETAPRTPGLLPSTVFSASCLSLSDSCTVYTSPCYNQRACPLLSSRDFCLFVEPCTSRGPIPQHQVARITSA